MEQVLHVVPVSDDRWTVTDDKATEQDGVEFATPEDAEAEARKRLEAAGGGELVVHRGDGDVGEKQIVGIVDTDQLES